MTATLFETPADVEKSAHLSEDGVYRYRLHRVWGPGKRVTFVMLNPSTADATIDDRTIGRCISFARSWGYDGINVVNLYAFRSTAPDVMLALPGDAAVGPDNDGTLAAAAMYAAMNDEPVVAAWGVNARPERVAQVLALPHMDRLTALGVTKHGHPKHPLYVPGDTCTELWSPR